METTGHDLIVVGASAGGLEALQRMLPGLPADLPAAVLIVLHSGRQPADLLPSLLSRTTALPCQPAEEGQPIQRGVIYTAVSDHHLLVSADRLHVTHGPKENFARPAIDPLFHSAALAHGSRVIGVVLSGTLDDGTAGLLAIKQRGGIAVCQDPADAPYPEMPQSAIANVAVDHIVPAASMGTLLAQLTRVPAPQEAALPVSPQLETETRIAAGGASSMETMDQWGCRSSLTCPECGGSLWELDEGTFRRFRCHTGHAFSIETLMATQSTEVESALWAAMRALEENVKIAQTLAARARGDQNARTGKYLGEKIRRAERDLATLRAILAEP
ncbi:MAG: chemotaxis protein CheB [Acidobacteriota bacterium]